MCPLPIINLFNRLLKPEIRGVFAKSRAFIFSVAHDWEQYRVNI